MRIIVVKKRELYICIILFICVIIGLICTIFFVKNSIIIAIITTLIGSAITFLIGRIYEIINNGFSNYTGYYKDEIFSRDNPSVTIRRGKFRLIEKSGNILLGDFTKYIPSESQCLNYKCIGFIVLDQILLAYRAVKDTIPSKGIIIVKLDTTRVNGLLPCYTGKCYKFAGEKIIERKINLIKIGKEEYDKL